jgi:hypothetical protein
VLGIVTVLKRFLSGNTTWRWISERTL